MLIPSASMEFPDGEGKDRERVESLLLDDGWAIEPAEDPGPWAWSLVCKQTAGWAISIGASRNRPRILTIGSGFNVPQQIQANLKQLSAEDREDFFWEMRFQLLNMGLIFSPIEVISRSPQFGHVLDRGVASKGSASTARPSAEELKRLPVGRGQVLQLDEVHPPFAQLRVREPRLGASQQPRGLHLRQPRFRAGLA